jgi:hypothetical protein
MNHDCQSAVSQVRNLSPLLHRVDFAADWVALDAGGVLARAGDPCNTVRTGGSCIIKTLQRGGWVTAWHQTLQTAACTRPCRLAA